MQWAERVETFGPDGSLLLDGASLSDVMWGIIIKAFQYSAENTATIEPDKSLYDYFVEKISEVIPPGVDSERKRKTILQMAEMWGGFVGSPVTKQSLKFFWLEECVSGGTWFSRKPTGRWSIDYDKCWSSSSILNIVAGQVSCNLGY